MKATRFLKQDHERIKELFRRFEGARIASDRLQLFHLLYDELSLHADLEEQAFYPAVRQLRTERAEELVAEAEEEHHEARFLLKEIARLAPEDTEFVLDMGKLIQGVEHHMKEEEESIFPLLERRLGDSRLERLGERLEELKGSLAGGPPE